ncbi:B3 domain-containing transcription factor VRN1-like isoform X2 [Momordica charantia]|nr:B3 domain-containing transcription factor VRN1-like isoform X2 [Momordica charantia]XP_022132592.1 B3 domain-containing transcription factor VRN1-like isoform X2 [Momordica charantia]
MIPQKFVEEYGKFLSSSVRLKLPDGKEWKVGLKATTNGAVWLQNGWHPFAEHYRLKHGSMLVLRLDENSTFQTLIFEPSGSEIEYSFKFNDFGGDFQEESDDDSDESFEIFHQHSKKREKPSLPSSQSRKKMRSEGSFSPKMVPQEGRHISREKPSCKRMAQNGVSNRRQPLSSPAKKAEKKPGFKVVMGKSNVGGRFNLIIPKEFAEKYLAEEFGIIRVQNSNGKTWPLLYKWTRSRAYAFSYISSGWKCFAEENLLKVGDVGFFQLIENGRFLFTTEETSPSTSPSLSPKKEAETATNPFFKVDIHFVSYRSTVLNIPMGFGKKHIPPGTHTVMLKLGGKKWKVSMKNYDRCFRFSAGWCSFYRDNALQDGDTCLFELLNKNHSHFVFKVTIFRKITASVENVLEIW